MNAVQKMVKYFAILLAASLTIGMIATVVDVGLSLVGTFVSIEKKTPSEKKEDVGKQKNAERDNSEKEDNSSIGEFSYSGVKSLNVKNSIYKVVIQEEENIDEVSVRLKDVPSSYEVVYEKDTGRLVFEDDNWVHGLFHKKGKMSKGQVYISIPKGKRLDEVKIEMGVGAVKIFDIGVRKLDVECQIGLFNCKNVTADSAEVEGGVGSINLEDIEFTDFQLGGGVGDIEISGKLNGRIAISAGMGNVDLDINGNKNEYNYKIETGLGPVFIDGKKTGDTRFSNDSSSNLIDIEGGIGTIHIDFN